MTAVLSATGAVPRRHGFAIVKCLVVAAILGSVFLVGKVANAQTFPDTIYLHFTIRVNGEEVGFSNIELNKLDPQMFPNKWAGGQTVGLWRHSTMVQLTTTSPCDLNDGMTSIDYNNGEFAVGIVWGRTPIPATNPWIATPLTVEWSSVEVLSSALTKDPL